MLTSLVQGSIRHRVVVIGLAGALVLYGFSALPNIPLDVFP
jgi:Cu/Ag efflux pump CusA